MKKKAGVMNPSKSRRMPRRPQNQKNLRVRQQKHRVTNREKNVWPLQPRKRHQPRFLTQNWQTKSRKRKQSLLRKKKNRQQPSARQTQQKRNRPTRITNHKTLRTRRVLAKQSWQKNLTTKKRQRQGRHHAKRLSPVLHQNRSDATVRHRHRNQRNPVRRKFCAKLKKLGNPNRREKKRKHRNRKKHRHLLRKSARRRLSGRRRHRKPSGPRPQRQRPRPSQKFRLLLQAASALRSSLKNLVWKRTRASSLRRRLRRDEGSGRGLVVRVTIVI